MAYTLHGEVSSLVSALKRYEPIDTRVTPVLTTLPPRSIACRRPSSKAVWQSATTSALTRSFHQSRSAEFHLSSCP